MILDQAAVRNPFNGEPEADAFISSVSDRGKEVTARTQNQVDAIEAVQQYFA